LQSAANRLEKLGAVRFDQRLEEGHGKHFAFTFVNARSEVLVYVIAEDVTVEERASAVGLHQQLDRSLLLGFAAEDLGDDAFHLAAVTFVDQSAAPLNQRVASDDQTGNLAEPTLHEFTRGDGRAVSFAIL